MNGATLYRFDDVRVDTVAARVFKSGAPVALEPRAYDVLCFLVRHPGRLVEKQELLDAVWSGAFVTENAMTRAVAHLRKALGDDAREARYLETVPTRGYRFIAAVESSAAADTPEPAAAPVPPASRPARLRMLGAVATGLVLAGAVWGGGWLLTDPAPAPPLRRVALSLEPARVAVGRLGALDVSRDGRTVAFLGWSGDDDEVEILVRPLDGETPIALPGTRNAGQLALSPDGEWVGYSTPRGLMRVAVKGGPPEPLAPVPGRHPMGFCLGEDGELFVSVEGRIWRYLPGGEGEVVAEPDPEKGERDLVLPRLVPGNRALLVSTRFGDAEDESRIDVVRLADRSREVLVANGYDARVAGEHLLFSWNGSLLAVPFDTRSLVLGGSPAVVVEGVLSSPGKGVAQYAVSQEGTLAYLPRAGELRWKLLWLDRSGHERPALESEFDFRDPAVSPNGRRFAFRDARGPAGDVWLYDTETRALSRLGLGPRTAALVWSPDGHHIAFGRAEGPAGNYDVFWKDLRSDDDPRPLTTHPAREFPKTISPDGRRLVFEREGDWSERDLWEVDLLGDPAPRPLLVSPADEREPAWSPDGRWLAFQSNRGGVRYELYLADPADPEHQWQVSRSGGREPLWTRGGRELLFRRGAELVSVSVSGEGEPRFGEEQVLFRREHLRPGPGYRNFDVTPDGKELLVVDVEGVPEQRRIEMLLGWPVLAPGS